MYISGMVGIKYQEGFHCYDFIRHCYRLFGIVLPHETGLKALRFRSIQNEVEKIKPKFRRIRPGDRQFLDIILFQTSARLSTHVGMVFTKSYFIHQSKVLKGVSLGKWKKSLRVAQIRGIYRWHELV